MKILKISLLALSGAVIVSVWLFLAGPKDGAIRYKITEDLSLLYELVNDYNRDNGVYPSSISDLSVLVNSSYILQLPTDPWGREYRYDRLEDKSGFKLYTLGRDAKIGGDGLDEDTVKEKPMQK